MAGTYYPAIPAIAQAYTNDPRTKLALQAQQAGASTDPVAGGKWAWASGLARAGSGIVGAIESKQQQRRYDDKQQQVMDEVAAALGNGGNGGQTLGSAGGLDFSGMLGGGAAGPQQGGVGAGPAAGGTQAQPPVAPPVPPQVQNNPPPMAPPQAPQGAPAGAPIHPATAQIAAALGGGGAATSATPFPVSSPSAPAPVTSTGTQGTNVRGASLVSAMLPITATTESNGKDFGADGKPVTSPKGARFAMQVMPATAHNPGFGIAPAKDSSPQEYNRVGTELLGKLTDKYGGDPAKAWAAYNCGTGRVDHALAKNGQNWLSALPKETQAYVARNCAALGNGAPQAGAQTAATAEPEYQIPGQEPLPATNAPGVPDLPNAPADRGAAHSLSLDAGRKLLNSKDPFLYEQAMEMLNKGMGEQFGADQKSLDVLNNRDNALYSAGIDDHYNAAQAQRGDAYATGREMRGYAHEDNTLGRQEAFQRSEGATRDQFTAQQNQLNRDADLERTRLTIEGKRLTAQEARQAKQQAALQTPQGAKIYSEGMDEIKNNNSLAGLVDNFMQANDQYQNTGGLVLNQGWGSDVSRSLNGTLRTMDSITHQLAPMIRAKGQGSMSDRDLEMFERAIPNIGNDYKTNQVRAAQFKQFVNRANDFNLKKIEAYADNNQVDFGKSWQAYINAVPVSSGKSYDDWLASIPHYDAQGNKK